MTKDGGRGKSGCEIDWNEWQGPRSRLGRVIADANESTLAAYREKPIWVGEDGRHEAFLISGGYKARQIVELTQNSADTMPSEGGQIRVVLTKDALYFADDGNPVDEDGVVALLGAYSSSKGLADEIGRFGLGFKSLLRVSDTIEFFSRSTSFRFDRAWSLRELLAVPEIAREIDRSETPVTRLAKPISAREASEGDKVLRSLLAGNTNVVKAHLNFADSYASLESQLQEFPAEFLLLIDKVKRFEVSNLESEYEFKVGVESQGAARYLDRDGTQEMWYRFDKEHALSESARKEQRMQDGATHVTVTWAVPANATRGPNRFWVFFPTAEAALISGILNARWNTNDDRTALLEDTYNHELVQTASKICAENLNLLWREDDPGLHLDALPPRRERTDGRLATLLRDRLMPALHQSNIVPDRTGELRRPNRVFYPPNDLVSKAAESPEVRAYRRWASSNFAPAAGLHPSAITSNRWVRVEELNDPRGRRVNDGGSGAAHPSVAEWLKSLLRNAAPSERPAASRDVIHVAAALPRALRLEPGLLGDICLTEAGELRPVSFVSLPRDDRLRDLFPEQVVHRDLVRDPGTLDALRELGVEELSPVRLLREALAKVSGYHELHGDSEAPAPRDELLFENLWAAVGDVTDAEAAIAEIRQTQSWRSAVRVRCVDGRWRPLHGVLLPGSLFEAREAPTMCVDTEYHQDQIGHLRRLDVGTQPRSVSMVGEPGCREHVRRLKEMFREERHPSNRRPRLARLLVENMPGVGPVSALRDNGLSGDAAARLTESILGKSDALASWYVKHDTHETAYPSRGYLGLTVHVLRRYGVIRDGDEFVALSQLTSKHNDALRRLSSKPTWRNVKRVFNLPDPTLDAEDYEALEPEDAERIVDRWPGIRNHLPSEHLGKDVARCTAITYEGEVDDDTKQYLDGNTVYVVRDDDEREELLSVVAALDLNFRRRIIDEVLAYEDREVRRRWEEVRNEPTDEARLLKAVGEANLLRGLPPLLREYMALTGADFRGEHVAQAAINTYDAGVLKHYKRDIAHLKPPGHMAGNPAALAFVDELGLPLEWAGERRLTLEPYLEVPGPFNLPGLHDYQERIVEQIREMVLQPSPDKHRALVNLPTGAGKTRVAVQALVSCMVDGFRGDILWVADREELLEQAIDSWQQVWRSVGIEHNDLRLTRFFGGHPVPTQTGGPHVIVASIQTLFSRLVKRHDDEPLAGVSLVVLDEAHHAVATSYIQLMQSLGLRLNRPTEGPILLGLTATPYRGMNPDETRRLVNAFQTNRLERAALRGVVGDEPGAVHRYLQQPDLAVLAVADHKVIPGMRIELEHDEARRAEEFRRLPESAERRLAADADRTKRILDEYAKEILSKGEDWPTLIFATSVEHAQVLAAELNRVNVKARAISGGTDRATRRRVVEQYRDGEVKVLVNYNVFREGFDAPKTRAVIVARPAFSPNLYFQMIGRGLRGPANGGNEDCLIMDVEDNIINFERALEFTQHEYLWRRRRR